MEITGIAEYNPVEAGLQELRRKYANVAVDVATTKALDEAKRVRAEIREPRYECEKIRKALKAPALAHAKLIDTEAARITAELLAIETPWDEAIKEEETRKEAEKEAKASAERARITAIHERIASIRGFHTLAVECRTAERAMTVATKLVAAWMEFDIEADFAEFSTEAQEVYNQTRDRIEAIVTQKKADEAERARIKAEQEAEAARLKVEREAQAAAAKALADERAAFAAEQEAARAAMERADRQIAAARLELENAQREAKEAADRAAYAAAIAETLAPLPTPEIAPEVPEPVADLAPIADMTHMEALVRSGFMCKPEAPTEPPSAQELMQVVARHFDVSMATASIWLTNAADEIANFE